MTESLPKKVVIFDLDGTLADVEHRRVTLADGKTDWDVFNKNIAGDTPNHAVVDLYKTLWESGKYTLLIVSGRSDEHRKYTERWLTWNEIPFSTLIMRKKDDPRSDQVLKESIMNLIKEEFGEIAFAVDDRQQVVDMWRRNGITCFQCDYGNF